MPSMKPPKPHKLPKTVNPAQYPKAVALFDALNGWKPAGSRVHPGTIFAYCVKVTGEETTGRAAARAAGITDRSFYGFGQLKQGHELIEKLKELHRAGAGWNAFLNIQKLAAQEKSLPVAMRANEWLAGLAGMSPAQRVEVDHQNAAPSVGMLVIHPDAAGPELLERIFPGSGDTESPAIDGQCVEIKEE